ncbi:hypothetical protein QTP86_027209 [Hemibagrus guttatus]|nr:hypothetical protein QTP86_027209 [Hemibagrus guttatus]
MEKAYDRVPREELWYCMRKSGVVRVVQDMYERSRTVVRCAVGQTEEFKVEVGLHQGSALSPFLFAMVMDQLSEEVFDENDVRRARFVGRQKEVNQNFAINLVAEEPVSDVEARVISCDGGGGALGHPKVYINLDKMTKVGTCGYCGRQFQQKHHH